MSVVRTPCVCAWGARVQPLRCRPGHWEAAGRTTPSKVAEAGVGRLASPWCHRAHGGPAFSAALLPLLEYCSVRPDAAVATHSFFGPDAEIR